MGVRIEHAGDVTIVIPEGSFRGFDEETDQLSHALETVLDDTNHRKILWDMSATAWMLSIPLGVFVGTSSRAVADGIPVCVCDAPPRLKALFQLISWPRGVKYFDTRYEALKALQEL